MRTKRITLFYTVTQKEVTPPPQTDVLRKDAWIKEIQRTVEADFKPMLVKVDYELYNPEVGKLQKFFHVAVKYYAIQDMDMTEGEPDHLTLKRYREDILDELLGYDYQAVMKIRRGEKSRKRKSTTDLKTVHAWNNLVKTFEETLFDSSGYEFPESEEFWKLAKETSYGQAQTLMIKKLQEKMKKRV